MTTRIETQCDPLSDTYHQPPTSMIHDNKDRNSMLVVLPNNINEAHEHDP